MTTVPGLLSVLLWLAYIGNETVGAITGKLWQDGTAIWVSALLFGVWAIAVEVRDVRKAADKRAGAQVGKTDDERAAQYPFARG